MIVVRMKGGLGNQMFQYAVGKKLSIQNNQKLLLDIHSYKKDVLRKYELDRFNIKAEILNQRIYFDLSHPANYIKRKLNDFGIYSFDDIYVEKSLLFNDNVIEPFKFKYIDGYFQNENYFKDIRSILLSEYTLYGSMSKSYNKLMEKVKTSLNSVSIHIRRGDFVNNESHGSCTIDYYNKAIDLLETNVGKCNYFIFSDDISWAQENLKIENSNFVLPDGRIPHEDLLLMSYCENNIIANSSFSWWSAWLNNTAVKTVIAPSNWFKDKSLLNQSKGIVPDNWIKL